MVHSSWKRYYMVCLHEFRADWLQAYMHLEFSHQAEPALDCTRLQCAALGCTELHWVALCCTGLHWTALGCSALRVASMWEWISRDFGLAWKIAPMRKVHPCGSNSWKRQRLVILAFNLFLLLHVCNPRLSRYLCDQCRVRLPSKVSAAVVDILCRWNVGILRVIYCNPLCDDS